MRNDKMLHILEATKDNLLSLLQQSLTQTETILVLSSKVSEQLLAFREGILALVGDDGDGFSGSVVCASVDAKLNLLQRIQKELLEDREQRLLFLGKVDLLSPQNGAQAALIQMKYDCSAQAAFCRSATHGFYESADRIPEDAIAALGDEEHMSKELCELLECIKKYKETGSEIANLGQEMSNYLVKWVEEVQSYEAGCDFQTLASRYAYERMDVEAERKKENEQRQICSPCDQLDAEKRAQQFRRQKLAEEEMLRLQLGAEQKRNEPRQMMQAAPIRPIQASQSQPAAAPIQTAKTEPVSGKQEKGSLWNFLMGKKKKKEDDRIAPPPRMDSVQFSAVTSGKVQPGKYLPLNVVMYEEAFRSAVDEIVQSHGKDAKESKSGFHEVARDSVIKVVLTSNDVAIEDGVEEQIWRGKYLDFEFAAKIPHDFAENQILFSASIYVNDLPATKLKLIVDCESKGKNTVSITRADILSAFVSYASQDRNRVAAIIQGMKKARPDMDIFFDVECLRSGQNWETALRSEIENRDVLFLCWSKFARASKWVDMEWRYALKSKGEDCIEPIPIDSPEICPPPSELQQKHFNDKMLYIINAPGSNG